MFLSNNSLDNLAGGFTVSKTAIYSGGGTGVRGRGGIPAGKRGFSLVF